MLVHFYVLWFRVLGFVVWWFCVVGLAVGGLGGFLWFCMFALGGSVVWVWLCDLVFLVFSFMWVLWYSLVVCFENLALRV